MTATTTQLPVTLREAAANLATAEDKLSVAYTALRSAQRAKDSAHKQLKDRLLSPAFAAARAQEPWTGEMAIEDIAVYEQKVVVVVGYYADDAERSLMKRVHVEFDR